MQEGVPSQDRNSGLVRALLAPWHSRLGVPGFTSVLGAPSFIWGLWPLHCPAVSFGKGSPHLFSPPFLMSPESQGPSRWASLSGKSHWYVGCPMEQLCPGKHSSEFRVQGQMKCQGKQTRWVVWGGLACGVRQGWGKHGTTAPREAGRGWGWGPGELEHRCGGRRSQWSTRGQCPRMHRWPHATRVVGGSLASACLAAPAVSALHLAWGDRVIVAHHCFLLSLISLPALGLRPGHLGQGCTVLVV